MTNEEPFSDMKDFILVALDFQHSGSLGMGSFWQTYKLPVVPMLMAATFALTGDADLGAWRLTQSALVFLSVSWLAREIYIHSRSHVLAFGILVCVALARSSIFWSFKPASESVAEAFVYAVVACALWYSRRSSSFVALVLGALIIVATLARANFIILLPVFVAWVWWNADPANTQGRRRYRVVAAFLSGVALAWSPWIIRNYQLYHAIIPISNQGPYTFLFELGRVSAKLPDGTRVDSDMNNLQREAYQRFPNDYEAARYAEYFVRTWLEEHWKQYPILVGLRAWRQLDDDTIYLTKVPRDRLFGLEFEPLLDKAAAITTCGLIGLLVLGITNVWALPLALVPWTLWPFGALFLGDPRMFEPLIPITLFGVFALIYLLAIFFATKNRPPNSDSRVTSMS
jgi:hypothetical protein